MNNEYKEMLRAAHLRVTRQRLAVMGELERRPHQTADALYKAVTAELESVSVQAIYDVVHALTDAGIVRMIQPRGSHALYELSMHDNHHHMVCHSCHTVINIKCAIGHAPCITPQDDHGFILDEAEVTYWGICPSCQEEKNA